MKNQSNNADVAELSAAFTIALSLICNQLIERGALNRDQIEEALSSEVEKMRLHDPSALKEMILSGLAFAIHSPPPDSYDSKQNTSPQYKSEDFTDLGEIDDPNFRLKLIGHSE